ncbi:DNA cytosine methyltransferase [Autumnicola edwardsiae]|uniref:DNA (cytosine-5-)-methyltransferase n=1 Tax=Autumnicola edwardsiae TaxID=3075594 RepID=A0ABU3CW97_9FLAO|nr:DNA cytosine methyltransferase [Zunongwangia sp. F297]MDT0650581.1 DNA cytosine methyltransferase [Zunongwangia sp. F297]
MNTNNKTLKAVDFFCSGGGMSYGLQTAGIDILAGIDNDPKCKDTYEANIDGEFILADVFKLKEKELEKHLKDKGLKRNDDELVLIGCTPCQFWSTIRTDKQKATKTKNLLTEFHRFVKYFNPGYVVVENVPGILRNKEKSKLTDFIAWLEENDYKVHADIHNVNKYGVPQSRKRFTLIADRVNKKDIQPERSDSFPTLKDFIGVEKGFPVLPAGNKDLNDYMNTTAGLNDLNLKRIRKVKHDGGNRFDFANDPQLQLNCFIGKDNSFRDTFGRLRWNKPSSTITTKFFSISCGRFAHPEEDRALSLREGAVLQTFPKNYIFKTSTIADTARIIGNAVPPEYSKRIGLSICQNHLNAI